MAEHPFSLVDTHTHLDDDRFSQDLAEVLNRAKQAGVLHVVSIGTTAKTSDINVQLAQKHTPLWAAVGLQPNHVAEEPPESWDHILKLAEQAKVAAIGETGLDRYWDYTPFSQQEDFFARHLELSRSKKKPVVIHCRQAEADTVRLLKADFEMHGPVCGVMHSFTGDWPTAQACLELGLHISFAGMVTYKNAENLRKIALAIPRDRLLVETDSPYLAPIPMRGKRNEPAYVIHTARLLAQIRDEPFEDFAQYTSNNAQRLFGIS